MKKLLNKLFSRLILTGIIILIQIAWIAYTLYAASEINPIFRVCIQCLAVIFALYVVYKHTKAYNKLSWVFLILFMPIVGVPCYFLFGRAQLTKKIRERMQNVIDMVSPLRIQDDSLHKHPKKFEQFLPPIGFPDVKPLFLQEHHHKYILCAVSLPFR